MSIYYLRAKFGFDEFVESEFASKVNLCQFVDAKVVTIELVIVHCAIDC